jgi:hypothetical protein
MTQAVWISVARDSLAALQRESLESLENLENMENLENPKHQAQ